MITITINERTKAGKTLLELANLLATSNKGVTINVGLGKPVATKENYNPKFVAMIKKRVENHKNGKSKSITVNPNDIWGSLGLK